MRPCGAPAVCNEAPCSSTPLHQVPLCCSPPSTFGLAHETTQTLSLLTPICNCLLRFSSCPGLPRIFAPRGSLHWLLSPHSRNPGDAASLLTWISTAVTPDWPSRNQAKRSPRDRLVAHPNSSGPGQSRHNSEWIKRTPEAWNSPLLVIRDINNKLSFKMKVTEHFWLCTTTFFNLMYFFYIFKMFCTM